MNKKNLAIIKMHVSAAAKCSKKLLAYLDEIPDSSKRYEAQQTWAVLDNAIRRANDGLKTWKIGYPKGKHRIKEDDLAAIRQWYEAPYPKSKVRALAKTLKLSPTTVYAVLKKLGWKKAAKG